MLIESDSVLPGPTVRTTEPALFAALRGAAHIDVSGREHAVTQGTALWVPAGSLVDVRPAPGAIVLPTPALPGGPAGPTQVRVNAAQVKGLLHEFSCSLGHLEGAHTAAVEVRTVGASRLTPPPAPASDDLQDLAELLADDPDLNVADAVNAAVAWWSLRTVQRRFAAETGMTLSAWVRRARVSAAAEFLARGRDIEWVAHRVGYRSVAGFTRSFTEVAGLTPGQWRRAAHTPADNTAELRVPASWERRTQHTWSRVNGAHIAVWAADGPSRITVGTEERTLLPGEAVILPAGVRNEVLIPPGSLLLPIGFRSGRSSAIGAPDRPAQLGVLGAAAALDTVESMLAAYTRVGTLGVDPARGFSEVLSRSTQRAASEQDAVMATLASLASSQAAINTAEAAQALGIAERELRSIVLARTGEPFAAWLRRSRMTRARNQLNSGHTASEVSRTLGYAHLPAFSRAFRAVHGTGPSAVGLPRLRGAQAAWGAYPAQAAASAASLSA